MTAPFASASTDRDPVLRISGPPALFEAIPYLLGFHPYASLVLVGLDHDQLVVTVRMDLSDLGSGSVLAEAVAAMVRGGARQLVAVVYADPDETALEARWPGLAATVTRTASDGACPALDVLLVAGRRWRSAWCAVQECCGEQGHPLPAGISAVSAAATFAGMVAQPDRDALVATLEPEPSVDRPELAAELATAEHAVREASEAGLGARYERSAKRAAFAAARRADRVHLEGGAKPLDDGTLSRLGVALRATATRDAIWIALDEGRLDGRALWHELSTRLPSPYDAAPAFLFGWLSWRRGHGALASIAAERAIASDPGYSAADLLMAALSHGLDPGRVPRLRRPRSS